MPQYLEGIYEIGINTKFEVQITPLENRTYHIYDLKSGTELTLTEMQLNYFNPQFLRKANQNELH